MASQNLDYYRHRADEELAAAVSAADPAIARIHRELARRYLALLNEPSDVIDSGLARPMGEPVAEPRAVCG